MTLLSGQLLGSCLLHLAPLLPFSWFSWLVFCFQVTSSLGSLSFRGSNQPWRGLKSCLQAGLTLNSCLDGGPPARPPHATEWGSLAQNSCFLAPSQPILCEDCPPAPCAGFVQRPWGVPEACVSYSLSVIRDPLGLHGLWGSILLADGRQEGGEGGRFLLLPRGASRKCHSAFCFCSEARAYDWLYPALGGP